MKRILALAASLAVFATSSFAADGLSLSNVKLFGEGSIYAVYDGKGNGGIQSDVLLGLSVAAYENVKLSLAAGYVGTWGENGITGGELDNSSNSGYINKIKIVLANIEISKLFGVDSLSAVIGRQFYGKEDSTAVYFGVRRYQDLTDTLITSADALSLNYNKDNIEASAIYASLDTAPTRNVLVGAEGKYSNIADILDIEVYLYNLRDIYNPPLIIAKNYTLLGIKPSLHIKDLTASVEFVKPFSGDGVFSNDIKSYDTILLKIDAAYNIKNINLTPRATFFMAGGKDKGVVTAGNYVPGLVGCPTITQNDDGFVGYANTIITNVGADYTYKKAVFSIDFLNYGLVSASNGSKYGISEIDISAAYEYDENISLFAGVGEAFGTDGYNQDVKFGSYASIQAGVTYKF